MKEYIKRFYILYLAIGALLVVFGLVNGMHALIGNIRNKPRGNEHSTVTERVFDEAGVLTEKEEQKLRQLIAKREQQTNCDIVLITLNESLEEYAKQYDEYASGNDYTMIYADNFWDENMMGYNRAYGDGILLVDNWYREDDGKVYTWICTTGKVEDRYSNAMLIRLFDKVYAHVERNPYRAYKAYINQFYHDMNGFALVNHFLGKGMIWSISLLITIFFILFNQSFRTGKKTTTARTYINSGRANFVVRTDEFTHKTVRSYRVQSSSGGSRGGSRSRGGGGHHRSSGGRSHGGRGRSR